MRQEVIVTLSLLWFPAPGQHLGEFCGPKSASFIFVFFLTSWHTAVCSSTGSIVCFLNRTVRVYVHTFKLGDV